ncbi:MAG: NADH-quinone oxidoreductase subunit N, partial [Promethearchaeota archaeon]
RLFKKEIGAYWALASLVILGTLLVLRWPLTTGPSMLSEVLAWDSYSIFFTILLIAVGILVVIASWAYMKDDPNQETYYTLLPLALLGMMLLTFAIDLIVLFTAWGLVAVSTLTLIAIRKEDKQGTEAAVKYLIIGAASSAIILFGIAIIFGLTGTTRIPEIAIALAGLDPELHLLGLTAVILLIAGFGFKMAIVPFHMWLPDTYEGAPQTVTALLAGGSNKAAFAAAIRVFILGLFIFRINWTASFAILSLITMTLGNLAALTQKTLPRMLAYSGIAQAGYTIIGLAVPTTLGLQGLLFHILNDGIAKTGAFLAAASVGLTLASTRLETFNGLNKRMPITAFALAIILLGLAGVPPLSGFFSKLVLFVAAVEGGLLWLAIAGVLNSAFSLAYYGWVIKRMYFDDPEETHLREPIRESLGFKIVLTLIAIAIVGIGLLSGVVLNLLNVVIAGL